VRGVDGVVDPRSVTADSSRLRAPAVGLRERGGRRGRVEVGAAVAPQGLSLTPARKQVRADTLLNRAGQHRWGDVEQTRTPAGATPVAASSRSSSIPMNSSLAAG